MPPNHNAWRHIPTTEIRKLPHTQAKQYRTQGLSAVLEAIYRAYCWAVDNGRPMDVTWYVDGGHMIEGLARRNR